MHTQRMSLTQALEINEKPSLVSIVGGGGKSALLFSLGEKLRGRVVLTTTTRIFASQIERAVASAEVGAPGLDDALAHAPSGLLVIGNVEGEKALGVDPSLPAQWLGHGGVQHVIVEADGSRMRPAKAPAEHEPVIAVASTHVVVIVGIDALDAPIAEATHRPERVSALVERSEAQHLSPETLAQLMTHSAGGLKDVPDDARVFALINKVEDQGQRDRAAATAQHVLRESRVECVLVGALQSSHPDVWIRYGRDG